VPISGRLQRGIAGFMVFPRRLCAHRLLRIQKWGAAGKEFEPAAPNDPAAAPRRQPG
jgi:hypothetical protein